MTEEEILQSPYGHYYQRLKDACDLPGLAEWWSGVGVFEYMQLRDKYRGNIVRVFILLEQQAREALNG